jgi:hypothetical protein
VRVCAGLAKVSLASEEALANQAADRRGIGTVAVCAVHNADLCDASSGNAAALGLLRLDRMQDVGRRNCKASLHYLVHHVGEQDVCGLVAGRDEPQHLTATDRTAGCGCVVGTGVGGSAVLGGAAGEVDVFCTLAQLTERAVGVRVQPRSKAVQRGRR